MRKKQRAANPINPRGIPRRIANKDVYRELARLDEDGPDPFERVFLANRLAAPERLGDPEPRLFAHGVPPQTGRRPAAKDAAALLLRKARVLDCIASHPTVAEAAQAAKKMWNGDEPEAGRFWDRYSAQEEQEEEDLAFELLSRKGSMSGTCPEEQSYLKDLQFLRGVFRTLEGVPLHRSREIAEDKFRRRFGRAPTPPQPALARELREVRRKRRRRQKEEADSFRRQLGNPNLGAALSQLPPDKQGQRIGEYRRAIKGEKRLTLNRPSVPTAAPDSVSKQPPNT